ncbi:MAG: sugar phosphate isomerase/epimerase [Solirubrobacteraceae bacterium]|nr:sugar phosphate isomerase/epimerase [Solirubrobacteraceae bacterium]
MSRFSICNFTLFTTPIDKQVDAVAASGATGMGVAEALLGERPDIAALRRRLDAEGLRATICLPALLSPLPLVLFPGPEEPAERVRGLKESVRLLAQLGPESIAILTGPRQGLDAAEAREIAVDGLAQVNEVAKSEGVRLALEPIHRDDHESWSLVWNIPDALTLLDAIGDDNIGLLVDSFHLADTDPEIHDRLRAAGPRIAAVHVSDRAVDGRSWADRRVPGSGATDLAPWVAACEAAGYRGHYDCEIFSDDGSLGVADYPDSLWKQDPHDVARACAEGFARAAEGLLTPVGGQSNKQ